MKKFMWFVFLGVAVGGALTSYIAPKAIAWYFEPPVIAGNITCRPSIEWALERLQWAQVLGSAAGAVVFALLFLAFRPRKDKTSPETLPKTGGAS